MRQKICEAGARKYDEQLLHMSWLLLPVERRAGQLGSVVSEFVQNGHADDAAVPGVLKDVKLARRWDG